MLSSEGPRSAGGAQGPNAGKDGTENNQTKQKQMTIVNYMAGLVTRCTWQ